ncbi:MAG: flagellar hook-length control protein FliK [Desulfovibrionaceae bacterium]
MQDVPLIQNQQSTSRPNTVNPLFGGGGYGSDFGSDMFETFMNHQAALANTNDETFAAAPNLKSIFRESEPAPLPRQEETPIEKTPLRRVENAAENVGNSGQKAVDRGVAQAKKVESRIEAKADNVNEEPALDDMKNVLVDAESFQAMKPQLEKYGITKAEIEKLEERVQSKDGLTWGQFVSFLSTKMAEVNRTLQFSSGQRQKLMTMFQKLGFSAPEAKTMVAEMARGNVDKVLDALGRQIEQMPKDKLMSMDKDEMNAFMQELRKLKGDLEGKEMGLVRVVSKTMQQAIAKARDKVMQQTQTGDGSKNAAETLAGAAKEATRTDASKIETVETALTAAEATRKAVRTAQETIKVLAPEEQLKAGQEKVESSVRDGLKLSENKNAQEFAQGMTRSENRQQSQQQTQQQAHQEFGEQYQPKQNGQEAKTDQAQTAWSDFMSKVRQDRSESSATRPLSAQAAKATLAEPLSMARTETGPAAKSWENVSAPRVLKQVQDAVLRNLTNGGRRLTIQLSPQELGHLSVALTVKNKEVQAVIRTDSAETSKIVAEQMQALRQTLEAQGMKVTKLEVQTQLPGQDSQSWMGENGHNQAQAEDARQRMHQRMRLLRSGESEELAQEMKNDPRQAILSGNGLHVIA